MAAIVVEPVAGNMGLVLPQQGFLEGLREITSHYQSLLIFDEVITGFRLAYGGAQTLFNIRPDLTCLGKIIGGGMPVGALGGAKRIMDELSPLGPVYQAGTLSGNPCAMQAGIATLKILKKTKPYSSLAKKTQSLVARVNETIQNFHLPIQINQLGSMFTIFFSDQPVYDYETAKKSNTKRFAWFYHKLLEAGLYFPPSQFETAFVSTSHTDALIEKAGEKIAKILRKIQ
jgi:glutamate-1-semialdehyde 2,1-aminomutase